MIIRLASFHVLMAAALSASAATWNATTDFTASTTSNPNTVWGYGWDPASQAGYQFRAFDQFTLQLGGTSPTWRDAAYQSLGTPGIFRNLSGTAINNVLPGQLSLHPGPVPNGDQAILRFTAPAAGSYSVQGQFLAGDIGETEAWIVRNSNFAAPLLSLGVTSLNPAFLFPALGLAAGDTLDFVVGNTGNYQFDNTPLSLVISTVPEAGGAALALLGLAALFGWSRRDALRRFATEARGAHVGLV